MKARFVLLVGFLSLLVSAVALEPVYVVNFIDNQVFRIDPITGNSTLITVLPVGGNPGLQGFQVANPSLGYTVGFNDAFVYSIDLNTGSYSQITPMTVGMNPSDISLIDSTTAVVVGQTDQGVYRVNLEDGSSSLVATFAPSIDPNSVVVRDNIAYVTGFGDQTIYAVNLLNSMITPIPTTIAAENVLSGVTLLNNNALVVTYSNVDVGKQNKMYKVDLTTGVATLFSTITDPDEAQVNDLALGQNNVAYTVGASDSNVYGVDLKTGASFLLTPMPVGTVLENNGLFGVGVFPSILPPLPPPPPPPLPPIIHTAGLTSSLLVFANYLNANAPGSTLSLFDPLTGSDLSHALESAIPTRNSFATFAAQNGYLASSQVVTDHLHQKRFSGPRRPNQKRGSNIAENDLTADATDEVSASVYASAKRWSRKGKNSNESCPPRGPYTGWLGAFGEWAREKKQSQTPAFEAGLGGAVAGFDYMTPNDHVVGTGLAYAYTHVHQKEGMGHANVNQGFLGTYGTIRFAKCYVDLGVWGGYYHASNHRKVSFPGFNKTANSTTHGWQLAPHFEFGYDGYLQRLCQEKWFGIEPFLLADWVANWQHGYKEHGASPLNMKQKGSFSSLLRGETGLRFQEIITCKWGHFVIEEKGSYAYQKMFHTGQVTAVLVGSPGSFTVTTLASAQNLGVAELSLNFVPSNPSHPYVTTRYQGEFGSKYQSHQGIVEIGKDF